MTRQAWPIGWQIGLVIVLHPLFLPNFLVLSFCLCVYITCNLIAQGWRYAVEFVAAIPNIRTGRRHLLCRRGVLRTTACGAVVLTQRLLRFPISVRPNCCPFTVRLAVLAIINNTHREPSNNPTPLQQTTMRILHKPSGDIIMFYNIQNLPDHGVRTFKVSRGLCLGSSPGIVGTRRACPDTDLHGEVKH